MLDYQRITDDVRRRLLNNGLDGEDFLQAAAADYSLATDEVNDRLRQSAGHAPQGSPRRGPAAVRDRAQPAGRRRRVLDFPERNSWAELLRMRGLIPPAGLLVELAAELNEAYATEEPLAALMGRHRLLAMSRGPLALRLQTLRELAEGRPRQPRLGAGHPRLRGGADQGNPRRGGPGDCRGRRGGAGGLGRGSGQRPLAATAARIAPGPDHRRPHRPGPQGLPRPKCGAVEGRLGEAHLAMDVDAGRQLRQRWNQLTEARRTDVIRRCSAGLAPALEWLREAGRAGGAARTARRRRSPRWSRRLARGRPVEDVARLHARSGPRRRRARRRSRPATANILRPARRPPGGGSAGPWPGWRPCCSWSPRWPPSSCSRGGSRARSRPPCRTLEDLLRRRHDRQTQRGGELRRSAYRRVARRGRRRGGPETAAAGRKDCWKTSACGRSRSCRQIERAAEIARDKLPDREAPGPAPAVW